MRLKALFLALAVSLFASAVVPAQAQSVISGTLTTNCPINAIARICVLTIPSTTTQCVVTIQVPTVTLAGVTIAVQTSGDNGTTWVNNPNFNNGALTPTTLAIISGGPVSVPAGITAPTTIALNVSAYTSGAAVAWLACNSQPIPVVNNGWTGAVPVGAGNTIVFARPGFVKSAFITTTGTTANILCYDNATTNSGTIVAVIPGTTSVATDVVGVTIPINTWVVNGFTCIGTAATAAATFQYQ